MESGERGRRGESDESREQEEADERQKEIDEFVERWERSREIDEFVKNWEQEHERESKEESDNQENCENQKEKEYQEDKRDNESEEASKEPENKEGGEEHRETDDEDEFSKEVDEAVRDVVRELEEEEAREAAEKQEAEERSKEPTEYDELEERMKEVFEEKGVSREEMESRWKEGQEADMEDELEEKENETTTDANESPDETEKGSTSEQSSEGENYHESGEGTVYATKQGSSSEATESTSEQEEKDEDHEATQTKEDLSKKVEETVDESKELADEKERTQETTSESTETRSESEKGTPHDENPEGTRRKEKTQQEKREILEKEEEGSDNKEFIEHKEKNHSTESSDGTTQSSESTEYETSETRNDSDVDNNELKEEREEDVAEESSKQETDEKSIETDSEVTEDTETSEEEEQDETEKTLDDSEPSSSFPNGYTGLEPWLPEKASFSLFPDEVTEEDEEEEETEEVGRLLKAIEEMADAEIENVDDLDRFIAEHPEVKEDQFFEAAYERAKRYLEFKQRLKSEYSEEELEDKSYYDLAKERGYKLWEVSSWFVRQEVPGLIQDLVRRAKMKWFGDVLSKQQYEHKSESADDSKMREEGSLSIEQFLEKPESMEEFEELLARHPFLRERKGFAKMYADVKAYFSMKEILKHNPTIGDSELARRVGKERSSIRNWRKNLTQPRLFTSLLKNERMRREIESNLPEESAMNYIDSSLVYEKFKSLQISKDRTIAKIAQAILDLIGKRKENVLFAKLSHYATEHGPKWLPSLIKKIESKQSEIEEELNQLLEDSVKIAVVDRTLFIWRVSHRELDYLALLENELFYFSAKYRKLLSRLSRSRLGLKGDYHLSELIRQITGYSQTNTSRVSRIISELHPKSTRLTGRVLRFVLDTLQKTLKDVERDIKKIGNGKQILNPAFPDIEEFFVLMARLFAIINSDGSLDEQFRVHYYEKNSTRRKIVKDLLKILGDVETRDLKNHDGSIGGFRMPSVLGRLLARLGMTVGDKIVQGTKLPDFIKYGSPNVQRAYLEDLIPEDGWVTIDKEGYARIGWSRTIALSDPIKEEKFRKIDLLTDSHIQFILKHGERKVRTYGGKSKNIFYELGMSKLDELMNSDNSDIVKTASELDWIVRNNGPELLFDEQDLCEMNGIQTTTANPSGISYSMQTKRASVKWQTTTSGQEEVAMWGVQAPPNDVTKKRKLKKWMKSRPELIQRAKSILKSMQDSIDRIYSKLGSKEKERDEGALSPS